MRLLKYEDICLIPKMGACKSRSECDTSIKFLGSKFRLPVMPSNMRAVIDFDHAKHLSAEGYFYSMHRFDIDVQKFIEDANRGNWKIISASLGVKPSDRSVISNLKASQARLDFLTIDIAHGHSESMKEMLKFCKKNLTKKTKIIAGNVATPEAVQDLYLWGADAVKVGIGQGSPCTTKDKTGFTIPMFSCTQSCSKVYAGDSFDEGPPPERVPIIADGGIRCNGDIAKAFAAGADFVMAGGLFASCVDSPAASIEIDGVLHKAYFGSASFENKKTNRHVEGKLQNITSSGMTFKQKLIEIEEDIQSSISYAGGLSINSLKDTSYEVV